MQRYFAIIQINTNQLIVHLHHGSIAADVVRAARSRVLVNRTQVAHVFIHRHDIFAQISSTIYCRLKIDGPYMTINWQQCNLLIGAISTTFSPATYLLSVKFVSSVVNFVSIAVVGGALNSWYALELGRDVSTLEDSGSVSTWPSSLSFSWTICIVRFHVLCVYTRVRSIKGRYNEVDK